MHKWMVAIVVVVLSLTFCICWKKKNNKCKTNAECIRGGRQYLRRVLRQYGKFPEKQGSTNGGNPNVTSSMFPVLFAVQAFGNELADADRHAILRILEQCRNDEGLYGYTTDSPVDSDDTAFAYRAKSLLGLPMPDLRKVFSAFQHHHSWTTFNFHQPTTKPNYYTLVGPHPEVHVNIALTMAQAGVPTPTIRLEEDEFGLPLNYHYPSRFYLTHLLRQLNDIVPGSYKKYDNEIYSNQTGAGTPTPTGFLVLWRHVLLYCRWIQSGPQRYVVLLHLFVLTSFGPANGSGTASFGTIIPKTTRE